MEAQEKKDGGGAAGRSRRSDSLQPTRIHSHASQRSLLVVSQKPPEVSTAPMIMHSSVMLLPMTRERATMRKLPLTLPVRFAHLQTRRSKAARLPHARFKREATASLSSATLPRQMMLRMKGRLPSQYNPR